MADRSVDVLLIGGGVASVHAARELRAQGFTGSVLLVGRDLDPPYERPPITKSYLLGRSSKEDALLSVPDDVEVLTRTSVMKLDTAAREAALSTKETVGFRHALVATGANVRRLPIDGAQLDGIHFLRALRNADALRADVEQAERVGIVGGSFIACEVAASLATLGVKSTLVFPEATPMAALGEQVGGYVRGLLEAHDVEVLAGEQVVRLEGDGDGDGEAVRRLVTATDRMVECQAVVMGVGAMPDVMLARSSGLELGGTGGVRCSAQLETSVEGIYAAGDMCEFDSVLHGGPVRIEHHEVAAAQGRAAARNMLGANEPFREVPYFWSDLADWATIESVGPPADWDAEEVRGRFDDGAWSVLYRRGGTLVGAATVGRPEDLDEVRATLAA
ncbi:MAG TPA: FAD-dependent oxidoreductase [Solirubrobacteraceae bacterium]|nr:FAD-dependent oxidoreductase [Solirubrobacteraceae bacterium]